MFVKVIFYFFKVFGLATMKFNIPSANNKKARDFFFTHSRKDVFYNILLIFSSFILNYFSFKNIHKLYKRANMSEFECIIDIIRLILANTCMLITLVVFCFRQTQATKILNNIISIKASLEMLNQTLFKKSLTIFSNVIQIVILSTFTWCLSSIAVVFYTYEIFICFIAKYLCDLINYFVIMEYALILQSIRQLFEVINGNT